MKNQTFWLWIIVFISTLSLLIALPSFQLKIDQKVGPWQIKIDRTIGDYDLDISFLGFRFKRDLKFMPGLDLQGGISVVLEADMKGIPSDRYGEAINSVKEVIERRVNYLGVVEPNIYTSVEGDKYRIVVELPGITDTNQVLSIIGETAQLDFREETTDAAEPWKKTDLTGKYLKRAQVVFDQTSGQPMVQITFDQDGAKMFEEITKRNVDKRLAIFLDDQPISAPVVQQAITGGEATISGQFTLDTARNMVVQLNAGALPVPVSTVKQKNIGPTLGSATIERSIKAGLVGIGLVAIYMLVNYQLLGFFAILALIVYSLVTLTIYKYIPVTLTLSGLTGFILSIGLAVDANILIFERIREELRMGRNTRAAINLGFSRAWESIRDANTATLITVFILFNPFNWNFLVTSGTVRGFAVTLGIGVVLGLFTGIIVTRTLIYNFYPMKDKIKK